MRCVCTQGWYQTGSSPRQPISPLLNVEFSLRQCVEGFNMTVEQVMTNIAQSNAHYGGFHIDASHILYTNGGLDPWSRAGILPPLRGGEENVVRVIEGGSHCTDFMPPADTDSPSLKAVRALQVELISRWTTEA